MTIHVWQGTAFDCESSLNTVSLLHSRFTLPSALYTFTYNNGAIVEQSLQVEDNHYTSQLSVRVSFDLIERIHVVTIMVHAHFSTI